jgi:hypothetical protein
MTKYERLYTADEVDGMIARAKAAAAQPAQQELVGREAYMAIREARENASEDAYFAARPEHDKDLNRLMFRSGFYRGYPNTPPAAQRPWVGLTDERVKEIWLKGKDHGDDWLDVLALARSFEAELKELNT